MTRLLKNNPRIAVLGDGGWGTTLAILLAGKGLSVTLWSPFPDYAQEMISIRENKKFLPGISIPDAVGIDSNLEKVLVDKDLFILAIPSQYIRQVLKKIHKVSFPKHAYFLSVTKGIEVGSLKRISQVIKEELGEVSLAVLSGPTIAMELARGLPTSAVIASANKSLRKSLQDLFTCEQFRVYTNDDVIGVELGGSLKNIIAIACGIADGLGFGTNAKAALLSRGLQEMARLGKALGAKPKTFFGLSGLGDLVTTCISPYSRNRYVGEQIGKGKTLKEIISKMQMVAEGVETTKSCYALSLKLKVDMPIARQVYLVLYKGKSPLKAVKDLMNRDKKEE